MPGSLSGTGEVVMYKDRDDNTNLTPYAGTGFTCQNQGALGPDDAPLQVLDEVGHYRSSKAVGEFFSVKMVS